MFTNACTQDGGGQPALVAAHHEENWIKALSLFSGKSAVAWGRAALKSGAIEGFRYASRKPRDNLIHTIYV
jgi:hypothetical protein